MEEKQKERKRPRIGIGYRTGYLTVKEKTESRNHGYIIWKCLCDCGTELELDTRSLQRGSMKDCGCISKGRSSFSKKDLTGQRIGKLLCIEAVRQPDGGRASMWRCRCDCGTECSILERHLLSGTKKSCGCLSRPPLKDFIGKRFGMLRVTGYAGKRGGMHRWECICDCGNQTIVGQTLLQSGKTRSCGCLKSETLRKKLKLADDTSVTRLESVKKIKKNNTSGYTGVYLNQKNGKWIAQISFKKKMYYLGSFDKIEDAILARQEGEKMHKDFLDWYYDKKEAAEMSAAQ